MSTTQLEIAEVDPFDDAAVDAFHAVSSTAEEFGREQNATSWSLEEFRISLQDSAGFHWRAAWLGHRAGEPVCTGWLEGSNIDNLSRAQVFVATAPDARGQGLGSTMLEHVERAALERGRSSLNTNIPWPYDVGPDGTGVPALDFATHRGYRVGLVEVQRQLALPVAEQLLGRLAAEAAAYHEGYQIRSFEGPVPDDIVQGWAELSASLMTEAPVGEIEREPEKADIDALRSDEERAVKQGRRKFNTAVIAPDGAVVAYTDLAITRHQPDRAFQWGTLVRRDHRGHRLGLAVKVANLRLLQDSASVDGMRVFTWNAEVNAHMIGVNEQVGFVPTERAGEVQKKLA